MADYYPLIAKAIAGVQSPQDRRAVYERGRNTLIAELRAIRPRFSDPVIMKERIAFEEAIRKVEAEAARRAHESE
jgi:hypothetical protein